MLIKDDSPKKVTVASSCHINSKTVASGGWNKRRPTAPNAEAANTANATVSVGEVSKPRRSKITITNAGAAPVATTDG